MTRAEIDRVCELFAHVGMIPVPLTIWREEQLAKLANVKIETKDGKTKVKPADTAPAPLRKGKAMKASREAAKWQEKASTTTARGQNSNSTAKAPSNRRKSSGA